MTMISKNLLRLHLQIAQACEKYRRDPQQITLLAVSKGQTIDKINEAIAGGQLNFGENYLQEAIEKITALNNSQLIWHFLGSVQRNKTKLIAEKFSWIHSIDRLEIAERLNKQRPENLPPINICIQVNVDNEPQKSGVNLTELPTLAEHIKKLPRLNLQGLMVIPQASQDPRAAFIALRCAAEKLNLKTLSMGMSQDFEAAIAEGATIIRLGTAIFGERSYAKF